MFITDLGVPKVIEGKGTLFAKRLGLPGACGIIVFYPGSFRPSPDKPPPPYAVTNFCSPNGLAHAYYNGFHEGVHTQCPDGEDENDCEELAVTAAAHAAGCKTVDDLLACTTEGGDCDAAKRDALVEKFPELTDNGGVLDPGKVNEFAKGLCAAMKTDKEDVDRKKALACACGSWNSDAGPKCQVPTPPQKPDGTSWCGGDPPTEGQAPNWPIKACQACDSLAQ